MCSKYAKHVDDLNMCIMYLIERGYNLTKEVTETHSTM